MIKNFGFEVYLVIEVDFLVFYINNDENDVVSDNKLFFFIFSYDGIEYVYCCCMWWNVGDFFEDKEGYFC